MWFRIQTRELCVCVCVCAFMSRKAFCYTHEHRSCAVSVPGACDLSTIIRIDIEEELISIFTHALGTLVIDYCWWRLRFMVLDWWTNQSSVFLVNQSTWHHRYTHKYKTHTQRNCVVVKLSWALKSCFLSGQIVCEKPQTELRNGVFTRVLQPTAISSRLSEL